MAKAYWIDEQSGRTTCTEHGGMYLNAAVSASPRKRHHVTPLDVWHRISADDLAWLESEGLPACETESVSR